MSGVHPFFSLQKRAVAERKWSSGSTAMCRAGQLLLLLAVSPECLPLNSGTTGLRHRVHLLSPWGANPGLPTGLGEPSLRGAMPPVLFVHLNLPYAVLLPWREEGRQFPSPDYTRHRIKREPKTDGPGSRRDEKLCCSRRKPLSLLPGSRLCSGNRRASRLPNTTEFAQNLPGEGSSSLLRILASPSLKSHAFYLSSGMAPASANAQVLSPVRIPT